MIKVLETASGPTATETGKYASAAVATLAALLETEKTTIPTPMRDVLDAASKLLESNRRFAPLQQICAAPASCSAWEQLKILEGALKLVKRRQRSQCEGGCAFELTDEGRAVARRLAKERRGNSEESRGALRAWGGTSADDVVVLVDDREGGGDRHHLHALGQLLRDNRAPFETRTLPTGFGDYVIARRRARIDVARGCGNDVAPVLIERKSAASHVAASLRDGRWQRQHDSMKSRASAAFFGGGDRLCYRRRPVDGKHVYERHKIACGCGCLGIGACGNPNLQAVTAAISERETCAKVVRTADPRDTARWLAAERKRQLQSHFREDDRPPPQTPEKRKKQPTQEVSPPKRTTLLTAAARAAWTRRDRDALGRLKVTELKQLCESVGEIASGNKAALVDRLLTPANPA